MMDAGERRGIEERTAGAEKMDVKKISEKGSITKILIKGVDAVLMNSIRRTIMNNVPVIAIEDVYIYDNTSVMFDEFLCHRLALIPIKSDPKSYKSGEKVKMMLDKEGPCTVYSKDIQSTDPSIEVIDKNIPIVKIKKGQRVRLEMDAVAGTGKLHAKWQPALVSYYEVPSVSFDMKKIGDAEKFVAKCPKGILEVRAGKVILADAVDVDIDLLSKCRDIAPEGAMEIEFQDDAFVMVVDNYGNLETGAMLGMAVESIKEKTEGLRKELKKL